MPAPTDETIRAAAAARRFDDAFRSCLAERGAEPVPLAEVTSLVTAVVGLRLAGTRYSTCGSTTTRRAATEPRPGGSCSRPPNS